MTSTRQLAAIMFTDIVGYTALMGADEKAGLELVKQNIEIQKPAIEQYRGSLMKEMGDGTLATFPSAMDAVKCALKIQQAASLDFKGKLRIGIHLGDITESEGDVFGDGVNQASRIESLADAGGIYVSESIIKAIKGQTEIPAEFLGEFELKNVDSPVKIFAIQGFGLPKPEATRIHKNSFWKELNRRNVPRASLTYLLLSVVLIELYRITGLDLSYRYYLIISLLIGLPIAITFAWMFEKSPNGFIRTTSLSSHTNPYSSQARKPFTGIGFLVTLLVALSVLIIYNNLDQNKVNTASTMEIAAEDNSIAVMYFDNMSGDPDQEYFSDGMTEEIIARLSMINELNVRSRTSVMPYKGQGKNAREIGRDLGVANILEGSVRRQGNQVRITAQLIETESDNHIWTEIFDFELDDIFKIQSEIAHEIASRFEIEIAPEIENRLNTPPTLNSEAYDKFLQARSISFLDRGLGGQNINTDEAIHLLKEAIALDKSFAQAYALLGENYAFLSEDVDDPGMYLDSAVNLARASVALDPDIVDGYLALGQAYFGLNDIKESNKWFLKAHNISPFSSIIYINWNLQLQNNYIEAYEWSQKSIEYDRRNINGYLSKAWVFLQIDMMDSVEKIIQKASSIERSSSDIDEVAHFYYRSTEKYDEFQALTKKVFKRNITNNDYREYNYVMAIFHLFHRQWEIADSLYVLSSHADDIDAGLVKIHLGDTDTGFSYLKKGIERRKRFVGYQDFFHHFDMSRAYAAMEDPRYIQHLNTAFEKGLPFYSFFIRDPFFDFVEDTPEYKEIRDRVDKQYERVREELVAYIQNRNE